MELSKESMERMKESLSGIHDPRRQWGDIRHKLIDLLVIGWCFITTHGEGFDEMAELGLDSKRPQSGLGGSTTEGVSFLVVIQKV
ncbi:MAG: transposase family protein [Treponema sp.]|jgi:hypothetical protein|nr:transposase family protein [Treponema sp.]